MFVINFIKRILYPITSKYFFRSILIDGVLKGTDCPFTCLFVDNTWHIEHLIKRIFDESYIIRKKSRIFLPMFRKKLLNNSDSFDLCISVLPSSVGSRFHGLYDYVSTKYVIQMIDTSGPWEEIKSRFSKSTRNKTNKFHEKFGQLEYRISHDLEDFDHFYYHMYIALARKKFGELAVIDSYEKMKEYFLENGLFFLVKDNKTVAGSLFINNNDVLEFHKAGVLDGDDSLIKGNIQTALYYLNLKYAKEINMQAVNLSHSLPFLNDGIYTHKKAWGASVHKPNDDTDRVYFFNAKPSEKIATFFEKNPLFANVNEELVGIVGVLDEEKLSPKNINKLVQEYRAEGIGGFTIVTPRELMTVS